MVSKYKIATSFKQIKRIIEYCKQTGYVSFDFETTGLEYYKQEIVPTIMGISFQPGSAWVIPLEHFDSPFKGRTQEILNLFKEEIFENYKIVKVAWNLKFEYKWLMRYGINLKGRLFDGMLAKYCLDEERPMGLKEFVGNVFTHWADYEKELPKGDWATKPLKPLAKYCALDCDLTLRGMQFMEPKLIKMGFYKLFRNLLMMATRVLAESEYRGMVIDRPYLEELMAKYEIDIKVLSQKMMANSSIRKYEKRKLLEVNNLLINKLQLEISEISQGSSKQKDRMIKGRKLKINQIIAGNYNAKDSYKGLNLGSPKQLVDFYFLSKHGLKMKIIKYTVDKKTKKDTKTPSTDESVLIEIAKKDGSGFTDQLLELRGIEKLYSTYIKGMYEQMDFTDNKVHTSFLIHGTVTGRLSCVQPNLQNIPRDTTASDIKKMFICPTGKVLLEVDYGQAELRVLAEMAKDEAMIDIFKRGYNIHVATAVKAAEGNVDRYNIIKGIIDKAETMSGDELAKKENKELLFWAKQKKKAKTINFGIVYGQGDPKLAEGMGVPVEEATAFKEEWFKSYPQAVKKMDAMQKFAREHGYIKNMFGRKRRLPDAQFRDKWDAKRYNMMGKFLEAMRQSVNAPIQGTSSDFALLSQIIIRREQKLGWITQDALQAYTVHDSIGFYIDPTHIHFTIPKIVTICDNPQTKRYFDFELEHVKMKISQEVGINWGKLKNYDPWVKYEKLINP